MMCTAMQDLARKRKQSNGGYPGTALGTACTYFHDIVDVLRTGTMETG